jgi:hypothetical protein
LPLIQCTGSDPSVDQLQRLSDERPGDDVSGNDERIRPGAINVRQDGAQRGDVAVDVGEHGDPHQAPRVPKRA